MRVNIYAEEMTDRIEIIEKVVDGITFTGLRMYLYLPVTQKQVIDDGYGGSIPQEVQIRGPFIHREDDDDSSAVTFWGKKDLRMTLAKAMEMLDQHYAKPKD